MCDEEIKKVISDIIKDADLIKSIDEILIHSDVEVGTDHVLDFLITTLVKSENLKKNL